MKREQTIPRSVEFTIGIFNVGFYIFDIVVLNGGKESLHDYRKHTLFTILSSDNDFTNAAVFENPASDATVSTLSLF